MNNRKGLPKSIKRKLAKGASVKYNKAGVGLVTWKDKKQVTLIITGPQGGTDGNGKPTEICDFNKYIGGVDLNNQLCGYYKVGRPSHRWWRYIWWYCVNVAVTNSWILFERHATREELAKAPTHKNFMLCLAHALHNGFYSRKYAGRPNV